MSTNFQEDEFRPRLDMNLWWKIFRHALPLRAYLYPLLGVAIGIAAVDAAFPLVNKWAIDSVVRDGADARLLGPILTFIALTVLLCAGVWRFIHDAGSISNHMSHNIRQACFQKLQELEFAYYDHRPVGWLIARLTSDCDRLARIIAWGFLDLVWGSCLLLMSAATLLYLNWKLALLVLSILPPLAIVSKYFQRKLLLSAREIRRYNSEITASFNEAIQGVRTTKTLVREATSLREFETLSQAMFEAAVRNARHAAIYQPLVVTLGSFAIGLALWRGGILTGQGALTLGTLVAFMNYAGEFFNPVNQMARILTEMQGAQAAGERVMSLLDTVPAIRDSEAVAQRISDLKSQTPDPNRAPDGLPAAIETIQFRSTGFAYDTGPAVLEDFNLGVKCGETIALVGPSGGGKSTLVSLLCRFYEPKSGAILVNGTDYRDRSLAWWQRQFGVVLQTPHLFKGTVRENIRYGRLEATDSEVETAARIVNAHDFIASLENSYDTDVGEGGNRLSTGQRQLISFARALLADPQIFIMDEATSSIDTETEHLIQEGLERILKGRISFIIAHRLSTIRRADRILVIQGGRIEESGTHRELIARRGHYFSLYTSQFQREAEDRLLIG